MQKNRRLTNTFTLNIVSIIIIVSRRDPGVHVVSSRFFMSALSSRSSIHQYTLPISRVAYSRHFFMSTCFQQLNVYDIAERVQVPHLRYLIQQKCASRGTTAVVAFRRAPGSYSIQQSAQGTAMPPPESSLSLTAGPAEMLLPGGRPGARRSHGSRTGLIPQEGARRMAAQTSRVEVSQNRSGKGWGSINSV